MPKLTLELNDRINSMLQELADKEGTSKVDVIRSALALFKYVDQEVGKGPNRSLAIVEDGDILKEIKVLH